MNTTSYILFWGTFRKEGDYFRLREHGARGADLHRPLAAQRGRADLRSFINIRVRAGITARRGVIRHTHSDPVRIGRRSRRIGRVDSRGASAWKCGGALSLLPGLHNRADGPRS